MRFGSVCSGIEAASVAWHPLGWRADWFAEIENFPSAVLAHHWPDIPNHGDMLLLPDMVARGEIPAPDVLVGGTPCQAFSVAGKRESLADERGALTLAFVELANEIDRRRAADGLRPAVVVWENVPGVLSTNDNAFGCFLAGLAGETVPLFPPGGRWSNAGAVFGPKRAVAWRILDAQYFGVAQRRRRVFVVASARDGFDPCAVLFEQDGLRRDSAPSREAEKSPAANAGSGFTASSFGAYAEGVGTIRAAGGDLGGGSETLAVGCFWNGEQVTQTLDAVLHKGQTMPEKNRFPAVLTPQVTGFQSSQSGIRLVDTHATLDANNGPRRHNGVIVPQVVHGTQDPITTDDCALPLGRNNGQENAVCFGLTTEQTPKYASDMAMTLTKQSPSGGGQPQACMTPTHAIRRLTPRECERLQGFPDDHTLIPLPMVGRQTRQRYSSDSARYKAIGNSMAVPVMRWIGQKIEQQTNKETP